MSPVTSKRRRVRAAIGVRNPDSHRAVRIDRSLRPPYVRLHSRRESPTTSLPHFAALSLNRHPTRRSGHGTKSASRNLRSIRERRPPSSPVPMPTVNHTEPRSPHSRPISLEPRLCQITMTRKSKACGYLGNAPFAGQHPCLRPSGHGHAFCRADRSAPKPRWIDGSTAPLLDGAAATISCVPWREYDGGDHIIFIGEIGRRSVEWQGSASVLPKHFSRSRRYLVDHSLERKSGRPPQRLVRRPPLRSPRFIFQPAPQTI